MKDFVWIQTEKRAKICLYEKDKMKDRNNEIGGSRYEETSAYRCVCTTG